jgi:hypothetical protein
MTRKSSDNSLRNGIILTILGGIVSFFVYKYTQGIDKQNKEAVPSATQPHTVRAGQGKG